MENKKNHDLFFIDNKSGYKSKKNWLNKNHPSLLKNILDFSQKGNISFQEKIYNYIFDIKEPPKCSNCNKNPVSFKGTLKRGYGKYCSITCTNKNNKRKEIIKSNYLKKYGVESHNQLDFIKNKKRVTLLKNYGVTNPMHHEKIASKQKETLLKNYGVTNPMHCPELKSKQKEKGYLINQKQIIKKISKNDFELVQYDPGTLVLRDLKCGHKFSISNRQFNARIQINASICTECNPIKQFSEAQQEIFDFVCSLNILAEQNHRINNKEIDIYIPKHNLGIEFNGIFWHTEQFLPKNYHLDKTKFFNEQDIKLLHFFEDEWIEKPHIIESIIRANLNNCENIYGRKCVIKKLNFTECSKFLNDNHLQGAIRGKYYLGLFYNNALVSVAVFGKYRKFMGLNSKENEYELLRFCNKINIRVIGGFSKLISNFIKNEKPKKIISYANKRYSTGELYKKSGWNFIGESKPNYWYVINNKREYRYKFRKNILIQEGYDPNKTENEIMLERKIYRIYDCGNMKFELIPHI